MIVKLFETENEKPTVVSQNELFVPVAMSTVDDETLNELSKAVCSKYKLDTMWVKWDTVNIKSKLLIRDKSYLPDYIVLNAKSFSYNGYDKEEISKHIEHHIQHYVKIKESRDFSHAEDHKEITDWFQGINNKYVFSCSCGFTRGGISIKKASYLRTPICCGGEYSFSDM
jgi:hypothetical protein